MFDDEDDDFLMQATNPEDTIASDDDDDDMTGVASKPTQPLFSDDDGGTNRSRYNRASSPYIPLYIQTFISY